jgi:hypothetical protein
MVSPPKWIRWIWRREPESAVQARAREEARRQAEKTEALLRVDALENYLKLIEIRRGR